LYPPLCCALFLLPRAYTETCLLALHDALPISPTPARALAGKASPGRFGFTMASAGGSRSPGRWWSVTSTCQPRARAASTPAWQRSEEHTSELQSRDNLVCRLLLEKKNIRAQTS